MRKLVLILVAMIAVVTFIRAYTEPLELASTDVLSASVDIAR